jgi:hypothetical protein
MLSRVEQRINRMVRQSRCRALRIYLRQQGAKAVYCGLLYYARRQRKKDGRPWSDGFAYYGFIDIFGIGPQPSDYGPPIQMPGPELEEWISVRPKRKS